MTTIDFDKEEMMNDEFYLRYAAREIPITVNMVDNLTSFIIDYINTRNRVIKKYEAEGKDTANLISDRDYALYILGLGERPERRAKVVL